MLFPIRSIFGHVHHVDVGDRRVELYAPDLSGVDLTNANLEGAQLSFANLEGAILLGANLRDADLRNANLRNADMRYCNLTQTDLRDANLESVEMYPSNVWKTKFWNTRLTRGSEVEELLWNSLLPERRKRIFNRVLVTAPHGDFVYSS